VEACPRFQFAARRSRKSGAFEIALYLLRKLLEDGSGCPDEAIDWVRRVRTQRGVWSSRPFTRVGAFASELESNVSARPAWRSCCRTVT